MTDRFQILAGPRWEKQWTIIRVTQAFRKTFLMRSNTTFHPEILFDWPPQMFHVLLEEHRKICVKAMSCMSDVIIPLDMLSRSEWLWLLLWCLQVPGQLDARLSSPSSSQVSVSLLAPGLGAGLSPPRPNTGQGVILPPEPRHVQWVLSSDSQLESIIPGIAPRFLPRCPRCRPLFWADHYSPPVCCSSVAGPGRALTSPCPLRCLQTISAQSEADSREIQTSVTSQCNPAITR